MTRLRIDWVQHPVGHGGFHTGQAWLGGEPLLNWIFDCGASNGRRLSRYLSNWTTAQDVPIDWLFVSHFDTDHVNGIDALMGRNLVMDVMVPFVSERELAYLLLHEIERGNYDGTFIDLVADPATFFLSRGGGRVTFLGGPPFDGLPGIEDAPLDPPDDRRKWRTKISPPPKTLPKPKIKYEHHDTEPLVRAASGNTEISTYLGTFGIRFKPYRIPLMPGLFHGLIQDLRSITGSAPARMIRPGLGNFAYRIAHHARTRKGRADLRTIYKRHVGSSNRSSMSLLSIPILPPNCNVLGYLLTANALDFIDSNAAWLNTGDAELLQTSDLSDWLNSYSPDLNDVRALALPHHGSDKNSDKRLQDACPNAALVAHVKSNSKKHPGANVRQTANHRLLSVTEQPSSKLLMQLDAW